MSSSFEMQASLRSDLGKAHTRRLRNTGMVPAVVYGDGSEPTAITMVHDDLIHNLEHEAFYSHILSIEIDGNKEDVVLKDLQRHPAKARVMHADFQRINSKKEIKMSIPLHFINDESAPGVTLGGVLNRLMSNLEISCLASQLPEYIEVDLAEMELGESIRLSQLTLPEGVSITVLARGEDHDQAVVTLQKSRVSKADEEEEESETDSESEAEE
ncbi:MAG: 50S ribosomal protein L25/general stress protein Ctc [Gammaproteobacteria bacterium]|nr:50S ribosomal protein L25/general stress protein Ctc [Gammaproteobacteria bacterium]MBT7308742.1 50S ribosomal protein L25/general stress protein Ctc [Gammaproteobacteria bacterium]